MKYSWDPEKEAKNINQHRVSFNQAKEALECGLVILLREDKDNYEPRYIYLGMCKKLNVLVVVTAFIEEKSTENNSDEIRIISARKANKKEKEYYERQL